jgi:hypothetical protein
MADLSAKDGSQETMVNLLGQSHRAPIPHPPFLYAREAVLRIRIWIHAFLGLPDPDPLVKGMDPDPDTDPSLSFGKSSVKNLDFYCFVSSV